MRCAQCGRENIAGRTYCGACGSPIRPGRAEVVTQTTERSVTAATDALSARLVRLLVLAVFFFSAAVVFKASHRVLHLPRFREQATGPVFRHLPVAPMEILPHPWIVLPVPQDGK